MIPEEAFVIESVVNALNVSPCPLAQFSGKRFTWSNCAVRPFYRPSGKRRLGASFDAHRMFPTRSQIVIEILRQIKRVPREQNLRHGRVPQRKIAR